jgi:hypothetical protein
VQLDLFIKDWVVRELPVVHAFIRKEGTFPGPAGFQCWPKTESLGLNGTYPM